MGSEKAGKAATDETSVLDLEYQYSPSRWSKRLSADAVIEAHVTLGTEASQKARESIPYEVLRYGRGESQLIDLYGSSLPDDSPIFVYVHGGYWQDLKRSISAYVVKPLYKNGIRVAVVGYDLAPTVTLERIVEEMKELDLFLSSWSATTGARDIWYGGHSAGAYLIGSILKSRAGDESLQSNFPVRGMVFISGIYDLTPLIDTYVNDELKLSRDEAEEYSLREINLRDLPNMTLLVAVAEHDSDEFRRQSHEFHQMLIKQNPNAEYQIISEKDHFDIVEKLNDDQYELTQKIIHLILGD